MNLDPSTTTGPVWLHCIWPESPEAEIRRYQLIVAPFRQFCERAVALLFASIHLRCPGASS
jgi:hypothetical protein